LLSAKPTAFRNQVTEENWALNIEGNRKPRSKLARLANKGIGSELKASSRKGRQSQLRAVELLGES
jgi:hypothetical protein